MKLKTVEVYRIYNPKTNTVTYRRTLIAAARKLAWGMIWAKYESIAANNYIGRTDYRKPIGKECSCEYDRGGSLEGDGIIMAYDECELHDRDSGYYYKLHVKLTGYLFVMLRAAGQLENLP